MGEQLFDLEADLKESTDVAADHPEVVRKMSATLRTYQESGRSRS